MAVFVRAEKEGRVATIRIVRPKVSGVDPAVPGEMTAVADDVGRDDAVRAVILRGSKRVFASGADLRGMAGRPTAEVRAHTGRLQAGFSAMAAIPKPVVAAISGYALGGGLEIALCADYRIAGRGALLGLPEIRLGLIPGTGGTQRLPRLVGPGQAKKLIFTGRPLTAHQALDIGLVDEVVDDEDVDRAARSLAEEFAQGPTAALAAAKRAVDEGLGTPVETGMGVECREFAGLFATEDHRIGIDAFLDGAIPTFTGR
ncbi:MULTISPECIES: enoyl-CoA hydratase/isomerase family protein [Streptomyces]|uniref:enoyl-CoA hydratase/isomerase family protein n=1 Tax=Streptomyces TaxID=1883 RepID=UPI00234B0D06|nr:MULTISPECIES: enoyl-CoA hydratase/isomerase family protein [Streptomyces]WCL88166.1 enoyl-CoA hydratase/isomerase family protein [Streptomyces sp. JCM 35825]